MDTTVFSNTAETSFEIGETNFNPKTCRCHVAFIREDDGTVSAIVLNLPGVGSCGQNEADALANVREAVTATVASFLDDGETIPWLEPGQYAIPENATHKWILVNA